MQKPRLFDEKICCVSSHSKCSYSKIIFKNLFEKIKAWSCLLIILITPPGLGHKMPIQIKKKWGQKLAFFWNKRGTYHFENFAASNREKLIKFIYFIILLLSFYYLHTFMQVVLHKSGFRRFLKKRWFLFLKLLSLRYRPHELRSQFE